MISTDDYIRRMLRETARRYLKWDERFQSLEKENKELRKALSFRGYDPDSELKFHEDELTSRLNSGVLK
jgi:cell shape-determining protein MreC